MAEEMIGRSVPFLLGLPSITAVVIAETDHGQYKLQQDFDTQDERGRWIHVTNYYYRDREFIDVYYQES